MNLKHLVGGVLLGTLAGGAVLAGKATVADLGGADRYLTHVETDKPIYREGETVYVRGTILHASKHTPMAEQAAASIQIKGPKGDTVAQGNASTQDSVWAFAWPVPSGQAGGQYTLQVTYPWAGHAPAERKFDIRAFRAPRLKTQIVFLRDGYGPGDKVTATADVKRAEGGVPAGARVTATALVDGVEAARVSASVDSAGLCTVSFDLPRSIARGDGTLSLAIEDGGVVETAAKTIPILLRTLDLALYPESGELVAGLPTRVYFEARTPSGKPADLAGAVFSANGAEVARVRSTHEGRGRFELTPRAGERYSLAITEPSGIDARFPLPEVRPSGAVITAAAEVTEPGQPVRVSVASTGKRVRLTLSKREVELASTIVDGAGERALEAKDADGVLVVTAWDGDRPLAERLVYRAPAKSLKVELRADKQRYVPGGEVVLTAKTTVDGRPVSAMVGLTVTDDAVLELIEKREQAPSLPVMVLLEPEVKDLADAHVYLDESNPKSRAALDLLLGTQGWRRFAFARFADFVAAHGDDARRVGALRIQVVSEIADESIVAFGGAPGQGRGVAVLDALAARPASAPKHAARPEPVELAAPEPRPADAPLAPALEVPPAVARDPAPLDKSRAEIAQAVERAKERDVGRIARKREAQIVSSFSWVREYAHALRPGWSPAQRTDFTETLFWTAGVKTDAQTGEAKVRFALSDGVTTFRARAGAFTPYGSLGASTLGVESVRPFYVEPKLPLEVTQGDVIRLPVAMVNGTTSGIGTARLDTSAGPGLTVANVAATSIGAGERARQLVEVKVGAAKAPVPITFSASAGRYSDSAVRSLSVKPRGFPGKAAFGGVLASNQPAKERVIIPAQLVPGTVTANVAVYPTPLANLTEALSRLIQEPSGCFEQTSSTTYPMTMAQQYFTTHTGVDPQLVSAAQEKLERGYKRLVGFECSEKGYEWFGENPGHEALTAYGLLHFSDMAQVREVDRGMIERSRDWLLRQRDGKGGFNRKRRALHTWIEDQDCSNGYILWALLESGQRSGLDKEIVAFEEAAARSSNSYAIALGANVASLAGHPRVAKALMDELTSRQTAEGLVTGGTATIVGSGGEALEIETTSLAALAWMRDPSYAGSVERAIRHLAESCKGGRYGSTQSTVLALRAIVTYDKLRARPKAPGRVRIAVDGQQVGEAIAFDGKTQGAIVLPDISAKLGPGAHTLELVMEGGAEMPYSAQIGWSAEKPESSPSCQVALSVALSKTSAVEGEPLEARAAVTNLSKDALPTVVAIVGLPGGLEPRHDQLKELVKKGTIHAYEVLGRDVVLYWRDLGASATVEVPLSLLAAIPGTYKGPASRAYLYYTDEHKTWQDGLAVSIAAR